MVPLRGSTGDLEQDMEHRQSLLEGSLPQVFRAFDEGLEAGIEDPVVFLVDCQDEIGSPFARAWVGDQDVDEALREQAIGAQAPDVTVTLALAFDFEECQEEIPQYFPYLGATFDEPPPLDGFLAVVVSSGGAGTFTVPFDVRPAEA